MGGLVATSCAVYRRYLPCGGLVRAYVLPSLRHIENAKSRFLLCKREIDCVQARFLGIGKRNAPRGVLWPMGALGMVLVLRLKHNKRMRRGGTWVLNAVGLAATGLFIDLHLADK